MPRKDKNTFGEMRDSGVFGFCGDYPSLVLALIWINRKGSGSSVMPGKWVAGETPLPTGWQALHYAAISLCYRLGSHYRGGGDRARAVPATWAAQLGVRTAQRGVGGRPYFQHAAMGTG